MCLKTLTVQLDKRSYPIYIDDNWEALFNALKVKGLPIRKSCSLLPMKMLPVGTGSLLKSCLRL